MATDLAQHIAQTRIVDSHEHQRTEREWIEEGPADELQDLFDSYERADLITAGVAPDVVERLRQPSAGDVASRWRAVADGWEAMRHTGYGEGVRLHAKLIYGLDEITPRSLQSAAGKLAALRRPGERLRLLRDVTGLDHIQTDDKAWPCPIDESGPDFFFYDISVWTLCDGTVDFDALAAETGEAVTGLASLRRAMEALFEKHERYAIAIKSQHAYTRTLAWAPRSDADAESALRELRREGGRTPEAARRCMGDWAIAEAARLAAAHDLPFKIHTGYFAGNGYLRPHEIAASHLSELLIRCPRTRFVLMHIAWPYTQEMLALAKHFPNVWVDLCWAWSLDPRSSMEFVRRFIHSVPINKLFAFGGDTYWPTRVVAYAAQARRWLTRALQAEVDDGDMTEAEAMAAATRLLRGNQFGCFDIGGRRDRIAEAVGRGEAERPRVTPTASLA